MRRSFYIGECVACEAIGYVCMDCGCCEYCCGNGFDCPSDDKYIPEDEKFFEHYYEETPPKTAKEVKKNEKGNMSNPN